MPWVYAAPRATAMTATTMAMIMEEVAAVETILTALSQDFSDESRRSKRELSLKVALIEIDNRTESGAGEKGFSTLI